MYEKTRFVSSVSPAPPISTASASSPTSSISSRSSMMADIVSASTRRPLSAWTAASAVVCSSKSSSSIPCSRRLSQSCPCECIVVFVTKRSRCPDSRSRADGPRRAVDRAAGDVQHALHVDQNRGHGARVYSRDPIRRHSALRDRAALLAVERAGRPARADARRAAWRPSSTWRPRPRCPMRRSGGSSRRPGPCCGRSRRTSAASGATGSSRSSGSSRRCGRRCSCPASAGRRPRPAPRASADWKGKRLRSQTKRLRRPPPDAE